MSMSRTWWWLLVLALAPACRCGAERDAAPGTAAPIEQPVAEGSAEEHAPPDPLREALDALCDAATEVAADPGARTAADRAAATWSSLQGTEAWDQLVPFLRDVPPGPPQTLPDRIRASADAAGVGPLSCPALDEVLGARAAVAAPPLPADAATTMSTLCALAARAQSDTSVPPEHRLAWWEDRVRADVNDPAAASLLGELAGTEAARREAVLRDWAAERGVDAPCDALMTLLAP